MTSKYVYPAIFTSEEDGGYSIVFPDIEGCFTCGDNLIDGMQMAQDALALVLYEYEKENREIPVPSERTDIQLKKDEFVNYIACDTMEYRKRYNNKAVKKTLSIPAWLNEKACSMNINFSQVLQEALMKKMDID